MYGQPENADRLVPARHECGVELFPSGGKKHFDTKLGNIA
jgi:hypothetical protein